MVEERAGEEVEWRGGGVGSLRGRQKEKKTKNRSAEWAQSLFTAALFYEHV